MKKYRYELSLALFTILVIGPALYYRIPPYYFTPDILYVKAKLLSVLSGALFSDPVTGFPTFHPPYYHIFLSGLVFIGIPTEYLPLIVSLLNICLTFLFSYLLLARLFDKKTALGTTMLIPFINQYMGPSYLFLATAFYFSVPFYLAGLWLYVSEKRNIRTSVLTGILWGLAFLISPVYLFLIGLTFLHELIWKRNYKRFALMVGVFLLTIIPFFVQAYTVYAMAMAGTTAFSFWRSIPNSQWVQGFFRYLLSPADGRLRHVLMVPAVLLLMVGMYSGLKDKKRRSLVIIAGTAYVLTAYHFNYFQYGPRILFFLSLLLVASTLHFVCRMVSKHRIGEFLMIGFIVLTMVVFLAHTTSLFAEEAAAYREFKAIGTGLQSNLGHYIEPGDFVLAGEQTYRNFIMPYFRVKGLVAYRTGEYYQVNSELSTEMLDDYNYLKQSTTTSDIDRICRKYRAKVAVIGGQDRQIPGFQTIESHWKQVYRDIYFAIYVKP